MKPKLTPRLRASLWGLRIFGPCSIAKLAVELGRDREQVYNAVYDLCRRGLAKQLGSASYDVEPRGEELLNQTPEMRRLPLFD